MDLGLNLKFLNYFYTLNTNIGKPRDSYNEKVEAGITKVVSSNNKNPKFYYGHFFIPHEPYTKDSLLNTININRANSFDTRNSFIY